MNGQVEKRSDGSEALQKQKTYNTFIFTILAGILPFLIVNLKRSQTHVKKNEFTL